MSHRTKGSQRCFVGSALVVGLCVSVVQAIAPTPGEAVVNERLGLLASTIERIALPDSAAAPFQTTLVIDGVVRTLDLAPVSVRAANYRVLVQGADGELAEVDPGPARTFRGTVAEIPGSVVAASLLEDGLHARILLPDGGEFWVEPLASKVPGALPGDHAVYRQADVLSTGKGCGNDTTGVQLGRAPIQAPPFQTEKPFDPGLESHGSPTVAELANDADVEYFQAHGSNAAQVAADIATVINAMNIQYERDVDLTHLITTTIVRTTEPDPYTATDSLGIITEFHDEWNANQTGVQRDVAQLFTGKEVDGSVIGRAFSLGNVCNLSDAYCFVQSDFNANLSCKTDLSSHELGHCWNAFHCDPACCFPNPQGTMCSGIQCSNVFAAVDSRPTIVGWRSLETCFTNNHPAPANDLCANATVVCSGTFSGTTSGADNNAIASCLAAANNGASDVWYSFTANASGTLTVDTCGSVYDTTLSIFDNCGGNELACNDDSCGRQSSVSVSVTAGDTRLIRVSGWRKQAGDFTLNVSGPLCGPCDNNGVCETGEDCNNCPDDCFSSGGAGCNNDGVCETAAGENCQNCPNDCNGKQNGNPNNRFCCGDGGGQNPVDCTDGRCTSGSFDCSDQPRPGTCCGDGVCEGTEDINNCAVDCGCSLPSECDDGNECTTDDCVGGACQNDPVADDTTCTTGGTICCGGSCTNATCTTNGDCDDSDPCSTDTCLNSGTCAAVCDNAFPPCQNGDGCCPPGCTFSNDDDCPCGGQNAPCNVDEDCCSLNCKNNGKCSRP